MSRNASLGRVADPSDQSDLSDRWEGRAWGLGLLAALLLPLGAPAQETAAEDRRLDLVADAGNRPSDGRILDRPIFFTSALVAADDAAAQVFRFDGKPRVMPECPLNPCRGTAVVRLTPQKPFGGYPAYLEIYPGAPHVTFRISGAFPKDTKGVEDKGKLACKAEVVLRHARDGNQLEVVKVADADTLLVAPGAPLHVAWTWAGVRHQLFLNGKLVTTHIAASPFPREIKSPLRVLSNGPDLVKAPVQEIALYNFAMSADQAAQDCAEADAKPFAPAANSKPVIVAQWAPGERRVYVAIDRGNELAATRTVALWRLVRRSDGKGFLPMSKPVRTDCGFSETIVDLAKAESADKGGGAILDAAGHLPADAYAVEMRSAGGEVVAKSDDWVLPATPWLGNTRGLSDKVQPPWTPIQVDHMRLSVWGREYDLTGGYGLPQQITSQGRKWLARPVELAGHVNGKPLALGGAKLQIVEKTPSCVRWQGTASGGGIAATVDGSLEYDGMMLVHMSLRPDGDGPAVTDDIRLVMTMDQARALFLNTSTDQGYWWYTWRGWIPEKPGVVMTNLDQKPAKTNFLFFTTFSDHGTGLEWFADSPAGWQVDETKPMQEVVRDANGSVSLICRLVNQANHVLAAGKPSATFGFDATPVKPLPVDWRSTYVHYAPLANVPSDRAMWWLWSDSRYDKFRPNIFSLRPDDLQGFASLRQPGQQVHAVKLAPFVNQHVTLPAFPENQQPDKGWGWFNNLLGAESANDGWTAMPTAGIRDYWAWNLDQWLKSGGLDGIYIDEANTSTVSASLLTGSGYLKSDGTHGFGHNTLGMREQLKRVRQLFLDNGKPPLVWIPVYSMMIPHAFAFVDVVSEGEAYMFEKPDGPDWIDVWGADLLERKGGPGARGGPWVLANATAQKFGFIPVFLNYIKFYDKPEYLPAMRAQYGLLGLLDIIPICPDLGWFFKAKADFGMSAPETTFYRYFEQREIRTGREDVKASYYRRGNRVLLLVTNLGKENYTGSISLDLKALGIEPRKAQATRLDAESAQRFDTRVRRTPMPMAADATSVPVSIPRHDFLMLQLE